MDCWNHQLFLLRRPTENILRQLILPSYRIFFADVLYEKGLYEEALGEYLVIFKIQTLELNKEQITKVESQIDNINKILLNN